MAAGGEEGLLELCKQFRECFMEALQPSVRGAEATGRRHCGSGSGRRGMGDAACGPANGDSGGAAAVFAMRFWRRQGRQGMHMQPGPASRDRGPWGEFSEALANIVFARTAPPATLPPIMPPLLLAPPAVPAPGLGGAPPGAARVWGAQHLQGRRRRRQSRSQRQPSGEQPTGGRQPQSRRRRQAAAAHLEQQLMTGNTVHGRFQ